MTGIQQMITDHMDIWTAADTGKRSGRGRASSNAGSVYGVKKLRELILELAVRGKLVPQDAHDEPASELLKRIQAEKAKLVAEGKIKKDKPLAPIAEDEKPFDLPIGWEWVSFGEIAQHNSGKTLDKGRNKGVLRDYITTSNLYWGVFELDSVKQMPIEESELERCTAQKGDLLICEGGEAGRAAVWTFDREVCFQNHVHRARLYAGISSFYAYRYFEKLNASGDIEQYRKGVGISNMSGKALASVVFSLPPLAEQHRIVAKVDELMALCDQLETQHSDAAAAHEKLVSHLLGTLTQAQTADDFSANWQRISAHFDTLFTTEASIDALKQTLLQLAVMGKLVPQDANDEPASELLKRIQAEKSKLVAEGKIKKDKPLASIAEDEKPFELPQEWTWVKLEDLMPEFQNGASSRGDANGNSVIVLRLADINDRCISLKDPRELLISTNMIDKYRLSIGDILIVRVNGSADLVGGFVLCDQIFDGIYCDHFIRMRLSQSILNSRFLTLVGASHLVRDRIKDLFITTAGQKTVNQGHIGSLVIPLLSIAEQHRIVVKVDALMTLCDQLKTRISASSQQQQKLADVLIERASHS